MFIKPYKFLLEKKDNVSCTSAHLIRSRGKIIIIKKKGKGSRGSISSRHANV